MGDVYRLACAPHRSLGPAPPPSWWRAALVSAGLSALFLTVYGGCNWLAARRGHAGTINFAWEKNIPFLPLLILPYLSIDFFFVAAPFLCRTRRELSVFTKRVALVISVAGICFLLFPFRFAFPRPHASGWLGAIFDWFRGLDAPYNLFPSLHIALCLLLARIYWGHSIGLLRALLFGWFVFIGLSAVFTYQHHVLDVAGGLVLGLLSFFLIRE